MIKYKVIIREGVWYGLKFWFYKIYRLRRYKGRIYSDIVKEGDVFDTRKKADKLMENLIKIDREYHSDPEKCSATGEYLLAKQRAQKIEKDFLKTIIKCKTCGNIL